VHLQPFGTAHGHFLSYGVRVHFLDCVLAELSLVRPRLLRTRFGPALLGLGALLVWLGSRGVDPLAVALHAGGLGAVLGAAFSAGTEADRAAFRLILTHPTTPLAVAAGRWLGAVVPAAGLTLACTLALGAPPACAIAGLTTAAAVAGCALPGVLMLGNGAAVMLLLVTLLAGAASPEQWVGLAEPGVVRVAVASALELGPALWRYREAAWDAGALLHAGAWAGLGIVLASGIVARRGR
jgi:hypothetical protein